MHWPMTGFSLPRKNDNMSEKENREPVEYNENNAKIIGQLLAWWFGNADSDNHRDEEIKRANDNYKRSSFGKPKNE